MTFTLPGTLHAQPKENGLYLGGFMQGALGTRLLDNGENEVVDPITQAELAVYWRFLNNGLLGLEVEYNASKFANKEVGDLTDAQIANKLLEVAYIEWQASLAGLKVGKLVSDVGVEGLDIIERLFWEKSPLPTPDTYSGAIASFYLPWNFELYSGATLGWNTLWNKNDGISPIAGLKHKSPEERSGMAYHSNLSFIFGPEQRKSTEEKRWLVNYAMGLNFAGKSEVLLEALYGQEDGLGHDNQTGAPAPTEAAKFWGGLASVEYDFAQNKSKWLQPLALGQRIEYIRDADMIWGWFPEETTGLTTQVAFNSTLRYRLHDWIDIILDYRADFAKGDRTNVSVLRNIDAFPQLWKMGEWYNSHQLIFGVVGLFSTQLN